MSAAKRGREGVEFDVEEFMQAHDVSDDHMVLGIDEAGRGPVLGPMVYTGAIVSLREHDDLVNLCHVADSKQLSHEHRVKSLTQFKNLETFQQFTVMLSAEEISETMTGRSGRTLNTMSHDAAIAIIHKATIAAKGKLQAVYVDTVGPPETYQRMLSGRFPHIRVTVRKKADSLFPIVSAASIVAKTTRDATMEALGLRCGSGYPADPDTKRWIHNQLHHFFVIPSCFPFVRHSWMTVEALGKDNSVQCTFEKDIEDDESSKQPKLSFAKVPPKRDSMFAFTFGLKSTVSFD